MKIISGSLKGRIIEGYDIIGTRPTMQRVKESLFATIQNHINNSLVLDLFAGTGNYGIEAISNGSKFVYFNDSNSICTKVIKNNLDKFKVNNYQILNLDYMKCLKYLNNIKLDLIFLDPPYREDYINKALSYIDEYDMLNDNGLVICELINNNLSNNYQHFSIWKEKKYGDKRVIIYKK